MRKARFDGPAALCKQAALIIMQKKNGKCLPIEKKAAAVYGLMRLAGECEA